MVFKKLSLALVLATATFTTVYAGTLTIHGSTTVNANLFAPYKADLEKETGLTLTVIANGSSRGIKGLDSGAAQMGMISADLASVLRKLKMDDRAGEFEGVKIGEERIQFAVHPSNKVTELSKEQVIAILNGTTTNWSQVGGNDAQIIVVTEYAGGGFRTTVEKKLLNKAEISAPSLRALPNGPQAVKVGAQIPSVLVIAPSKMLAGTSLKTLVTDAEIVQPLLLVTKGAPTADAAKLIEAAKAKLK